PAYQDVLVQHREADRCLAVAAARRENLLTLDVAQETEWASKWRGFKPDFTISPAAGESQSPTVNSNLSELRRFLMLPAHESLRRHLRVEADEEPVVEDNEPLITTQQAAGAFMRHTMQQLVRAAAH